MKQNLTDQNTASDVFFDILKFLRFLKIFKDINHCSVEALNEYRFVDFLGLSRKFPEFRLKKKYKKNTYRNLNRVRARWITKKSGKILVGQISALNVEFQIYLRTKNKRLSMILVYTERFCESESQTNTKNVSEFLKLTLQNLKEF